MSFRGGGRFHGPAGAAVPECWRGPGSGGDGAADGDRRGCLAGGGAAPGGGECLPGFGLAVAVPVPVDDDAACAQIAEGAGAPGRGERAGQAGGGRAGPGGGDRGAAGGGEGDLPGLDGLPGAAWSPGIFVDISIMLLLVPDCQIGAHKLLGLSCRADVVSGRDCNIARCSRTRRS